MNLMRAKQHIAINLELNKIKFTQVQNCEMSCGCKEIQFKIFPCVFSNAKLASLIFFQVSFAVLFIYLKNVIEQLVKAVGNNFSRYKYWLSRGVRNAQCSGSVSLQMQPLICSRCQKEKLKFPSPPSLLYPARHVHMVAM